MKNFKLFTSAISSFFLIAICTFFSIPHLNAQNAPIYLNWDKIGCQLRKEFYLK